MSNRSTEETKRLAEIIMNASAQDTAAVKEKSLLLRSHIEACKIAWPKLNRPIIEEYRTETDTTLFDEKGIKLSGFFRKELWLLSDGRIMETDKGPEKQYDSTYTRTKKIIGDLDEVMQYYNVDACIAGLHNGLTESAEFFIESAKKKRDDIASANEKFPLSN